MRFTTGLLLLLSAAPLFTQAAYSQRTVVESLSITSDSSVSSQHLQQIEQEIRKHDYPPDAGQEIAQRANYELQKDGYFQAETSIAKIQVLSDSPARPAVAVTLRINEGQQFRLKQIVFQNNKVFSSAQLRAEFLIADGDVFDAEKIRKGFEALRVAYQEKGYINVVPVPGTVADQSGWVKLIVDMDEGAQFTMESFELQGREEWPPDKAEKVLNIWRPYAEHVYNPRIIEQIQQAMMELFPGISSDDALPAIRQNPERKAVDIELSLPATLTAK